MQVPALLMVLCIKQHELERPAPPDTTDFHLFNQGEGIKPSCLSCDQGWVDAALTLTPSSCALCRKGGEREEGKGELRAHVCLALTEGGDP